MRSRVKRNIALIFIPSNLLLLAVSLVYGAMVARALVDGVDVVSCFCKETFAFYCPGCGGSRSLYYLLRLDLLRSFIYFPALPVAAVMVAELDVRAAIAFKKQSYAPILSFNLDKLLALPVLIFASFILRNALLLFGIDYIGDILG